jgi:hypothetical protein
LRVAYRGGPSRPGCTQTVPCVYSAGTPPPPRRPPLSPHGRPGAHPTPHARGVERVGCSCARVTASAHGADDAPRVGAPVQLRANVSELVGRIRAPGGWERGRTWRPETGPTHARGVTKLAPAGGFDACRGECHRAASPLDARPVASRRSPLAAPRDRGVFRPPRAREGGSEWLPAPRALTPRRGTFWYIRGHSRGLAGGAPRARSWRRYDGGHPASVLAVEALPRDAARAPL